VRSWLAIPCLMVLLFGCTTAPERLPPYALSDAEVTAVVRGFYSSEKDLDAPSFRSLKAVRSSGGEVYVCGGLSSRNAGEQVFIGTLSAGRFVPDRIAKINILPAKFWQMPRTRHSDPITGRGLGPPPTIKRASSAGSYSARFGPVKMQEVSGLGRRLLRVSL